MPRDPLHTQNAHLLSLQGIENFRDVGGYQTDDGRCVRWGKIFRCGHLMQMTEIDGELLESLAIKAIFDLRTPPERQSFPTAWQCALQPEIHTIDVHAEGDDPKADLFQLILDGQISQDDVRSHMLGDYALMPYQFAPMLKKICQHLLATPEGGIVMHCTAGKDRTGLVVGLLLALLGVPEKSIYEDYLLSNEGFSCREKLEHMVATFGHKVENIDACMAVLKPLIQVEDDYLKTALDAIDKQSGSLQRYFEKTLELTTQQRESLQALLLQSA
jgi:protein-tyrosine phosphatase